MNEKVDCDSFDNELMAIREMIGNLEPGEENKHVEVTTQVLAAAPKERGPNISSKDLNRIREVIEKFPGVEETLGKISK